jgi:hypothetical protein
VAGVAPGVTTATLVLAGLSSRFGVIGSPASVSVVSVILLPSLATLSLFSSLSLSVSTLVDRVGVR